jgi:hypothetical protein
VKLSAGFSVRQTWALIDAHAPEGDGAEHRCLIVAGPCRPNASDNPHELIRQAHALWIGAVYLGSSVQLQQVMLNLIINAAGSDE